jgi:hypothetical protein
MERDTIAELYIDPNASVLSDKDRAIIINALSSLSEAKKAFDTIKIKSNDNVYSIINRNFNYLQSSNYYSTNNIKDKVKDINNLNSKLMINEGDELLIPVIPKYLSSKNSSTQVFDFVSSNSYEAYTLNSSELEDSKSLYETEAGLSTGHGNILNLDESPANNLAEIVLENVGDTSQPGYWAYKISKSDLKLILDNIPIDIQKKLYGNAMVIVNDDPSFVELNFDNPNKISLNEIPLTNKGLTETNYDLKNKLSSLRSVDFGSYYLLDFFDKSCSHGEAVMAVIKQRIREYGLDTLKIKIVPVQIDYYKDQDSSISFLKKCYKYEWLPRMTKIELLSNINSLIRLRAINALPKFF